MAIACLSTGPVGPNDLVGKFNKTLIMMSCMLDGRLLKPQVPAMSIDAEFYEYSYNTGIGPHGNVWRAYTYHSGYYFYNIFANNLTMDYDLAAHEIYPYYG